MSCKTRVRGTEDLCISPSDKERVHWKEYIRSRSLSGNSPVLGSFCMSSESSDSVQSSKGFCGSYDDEEDAGFGDHFPYPASNGDSGMGSGKKKRRSRCESECSVTDVSWGLV